MVSTQTPEGGGVDEENGTFRLVKQSPVGMLVVDAEGQIRFANPAAASLLNASLENLMDAPLGLPLTQGLGTELEIQRGSGEIGVAETVATPLEWDGASAHLVTLHDVTERNLAEETLRSQALHDALTGLPNREHFTQHLDEGIRMARAQVTTFAVLFLDLDRFKAVNDALGHTAGDEMLRIIADRLRKAIRDTDVAARLSGDEFVLLLKGVPDRATALSVAEKIRSQVFKPLPLLGQTLTPTGTIGISLFPEDEVEPEALIQRADQAMYMGKESGRDQITEFAANPREPASRRLNMEQQLRQALTNREFRVFYQPQVGFRGQLPQVEALLRWYQPNQGLMSPGEFIPLMEETGMIEEVGEWVLQQAAADLQEWDETGPRVERVWVNVSPRQLRKTDLATQFDRLQEATGVNPERFGVELTETELAQDVELSTQTLRALKARGCRIALDDFGKGYSALKFLRDLPIDVLKIDRDFVINLPQDEDDASVVRTIIAMAHNMGMEGLAEGVETQEQADFLTREGCDAAQGFLFGHPVPSDQLLPSLQ